MKICYHGTDAKNAQSILKQGFRPETWFAAHLEDALEFGGNHVFRVVFDDPPDYWQFFINRWIKPDQIVGYEVYQVEQIINKIELREKLFQGKP